MPVLLLALAVGWLTGAHVAPATAQTEVAARRECLRAIRDQGVRGFALERPRFTRTSGGASLSGQMVQGPSRLDFTCAIDRRATVTDLAVTRAAP